MISISLRAAAWTLLAAIVAISVVPPFLRPVTGSPANLEHMAIFMISGLVFGLGYRSHHLHQAIGLVIFAGAVELAQLYIPGRHARISDFLIDAIAASAGAFAAWLAVQRISRRS